MKTEIDTSGLRRVPALGPIPRWADMIRLIRRFPQRLRERRFWYVQALMLLATVPHYTFEALGLGDPSEVVYGLAIIVYMVPLLYAALAFGWEGAILTGLWAAVLTSPSLWLWDHSIGHWAGELGQLAIILPVAVLMAWRVDLEAKQRLRAEKTSADLKVLNEVGETLSNALEVEQQLPEVVRRVQQGMSLESAWLCLEPESGGLGPLTTVESSDPPSPPPTDLALDLHHRVVAQQRTVRADGQAAAVPLLAEETGMLGSLGAKAAGDETLSDSQVGLLTTVARQVRVALENARLYRQRQESMQSYVRQVTQAQEDERLRIARELHDETAQELVHLARKLEQLRNRAEPGLTEEIQDLLNMARGTIQAVRRYSRDLRPSVLDDLGLLAALEMVVEDTSRQLSKGARLQVTGQARRLDGPVELALFRIAQESLRNIEKHANATSATVELDFSDEAMTLSVADDGRGFSPAKNVSDLVRTGKLGLLGMKERAELVGGSFELRSIPGGGTKVVVTVRPGGRSSGGAEGPADLASDDFVVS